MDGRSEVRTRQAVGRSLTGTGELLTKLQTGLRVEPQAEVIVAPPGASVKEATYASTRAAVGNAR